MPRGFARRSNTSRARASPLTGGLRFVELSNNHAALKPSGVLPRLRAVDAAQKRRNINYHREPRGSEILPESERVGVAADGWQERHFVRAGVMQHHHVSRTAQLFKHRAGQADDATIAGVNRDCVSFDA